MTPLEEKLKAIIERNYDSDKFLTAAVISSIKEVFAEILPEKTDHYWYNECRSEILKQLE